MRNEHIFCRCSLIHNHFLRTLYMGMKHRLMHDGAHCVERSNFLNEIPGLLSLTWIEWVIHDIMGR